ncbi:MAG: AAA family ATPase [Candidatus Spechtbacterales bacterium]|nr:AAA family ATPase [Candidatus Spechtbacterales bacterium]
MKEIQGVYRDIMEQTYKRVKGHSMRKGAKYMVVGIFANGHILVEAVPGTGKTLTATTFGEVLDMDFGRIQLTPDTKPKEIQMEVELKGKYDFEFKPGPIYVEYLLTDEINRTPATTQSAILEPMEERQLTTPELGTVILPEPFLVVSTQNPIEQEGTYPLSEAQRSRYMMKIKVEPARRAELVEIALSDNKTPVKKLYSTKDVLEIQKIIDEEIDIKDDLVNKAAGVAELTWKQYSDIANGVFKSGVSNRGPKYLVRASKALAAINGREFVTERDIAELLYPTYWHTVVFEEYEKDKYESIFDETMRKIISKVFPELLDEELYYAIQ